MGNSKESWRIVPVEDQPDSKALKEYNEYFPDGIRYADKGYAEEKAEHMATFLGIQLVVEPVQK